MLYFIYSSTFVENGKLVFTLFDDAMISMGYAKTLALSGQLTWFPGGNRVEGFTNLLWMLWLAVIHKMGFYGSYASLAVSISNLLLILLISYAAFRTVVLLVPGKDSRGRNKKALLVAGLVPFLYPLTFWSLRGMETALLALLLLGIAFTTTYSESISGSLKFFLWRTSVLAALGILGILTRMDFFIPVVFILAYLIFFTHSKLHKFIYIIVAALLFVTLLSILVWQYSYFGDALTNTYRLKVGGVDIQKRLTRGLVSAAKFLPLLLLLFRTHLRILRLKSISQIRFFSEIALGATTCIACYSVWAGGDAWEFMGINRYLAITLPLALTSLIASASYGFDHTKARGLIAIRKSIIFIIFSSICLSLTTNPFGISSKMLIVSLLAGLLILGFFFALQYILTGNHMYNQIIALSAITVLMISNFTPSYNALRYGFHPFYVVEDFKITQISKELKLATLDGASIAVSWAGTPGYYTDRKMVDLFGKSDRTIANEKPRFNLPRSAWNRDFYPGHNKFNYDYSIGFLKPDVVVDLALPANLSKWGYSQYCLGSGVGIYVLSNSQHVDFNKIRSCIF